MGATLLVISVGALLMMWFIDFFTSWYARFLSRWMPYPRIRVLLGQLVWALLAVIFWYILFTRHLPDLHNPTYFFFVIFIYSVRGLVESLVKGRKHSSSADDSAA